MSRIGGAERLCHLGKAGAGEDDGRLKQGGARSPGTRTGGAGRLCRLSKAGAGEDDGRLKQGGARPPGDSNWWCREAVPPEKGGI